MDPDYMTTEETGKMLRTPVETLRWWRHRDQGPPSFKLGRRVLYSRREVLDWIQRERAAQDGHVA